MATKSKAGAPSPWTSAEAENRGRRPVVVDRETGQIETGKARTTKVRTSWRDQMD